MQAPAEAQPVTVSYNTATHTSAHFLRFFMEASEAEVVLNTNGSQGKERALQGKDTKRLRDSKT